MDQVKIGFIGTGLIATTHMIFIRQIMETLPEGSGYPWARFLIWTGTRPAPLLKYMVFRPR